MRATEFKMNLSGRNYTPDIYDFKVESYESTRDIVQVSKSRPLLHKCNRDCDFLVNEFGVADASYWFNGFTSCEELIQKTKTGLTDVECLKSIRNYTKSVKTTKMAPKAKSILNVAGGPVCTPKYLAGDPRCRIMRTKVSCQDPVARIGVNLSIPADVDKNDIEKVGKAIAISIARIEKAGVGVRLNMLTCRTTLPHTVVCLNHCVKRENAPMDLKKMLYPLMDVSYLRGVTFGWVVRHPCSYNRSGIGHNFVYDIHARSEETQQIQDAVYSRILGKGAITFSLPDLIKLSEDELIAMIEKRVLG